MPAEPNYRGPGRYRHFRGTEYEVLGLAADEETKLQGQTRVIYKPLTSGSILEGREESFWGRLLSDFNAQVFVSGSGTEERETIPRFHKVPMPAERLRPERSPKPSRRGMLVRSAKCMTCRKKWIDVGHRATACPFCGSPAIYHKRIGKQMPDE
jgi:DNA-directed RNA polymerase subunit RPC12/RpoP